MVDAGHQTANGLRALILTINRGDTDRDFKVGERVELYPSNLDMSTAVYDRYYIARGEQIVDVWPIMGRAGAAQR